MESELEAQAISLTLLCEIRYLYETQGIYLLFDATNTFVGTAQATRIKTAVGDTGYVRNIHYLFSQWCHLKIH